MTQSPRRFSPALFIAACIVVAASARSAVAAAGSRSGATRGRRDAAGAAAAGRLAPGVDEVRSPTSRRANFKPSSRGEMMKYMKDVATVSVEAADKILPQVKPDDPLYAGAATLKLESLMMLGRMGDKAAAAGDGRLREDARQQPRARSRQGSPAARAGSRRPATLRDGQRGRR